MTEEPLDRLFDRASSVLAATPDGREAAFRDLVAPRLDARNLLAVLYDRPASAFLGRLAADGEGRPGDLRVLAVGEPMRSAADAEADAEWPATNLVRTVRRVDDRETVIRQVDRSLTAWADAEPPTLVYVDSLAPLVAAVGAPRAGDFLEEVGATVRRHRARGLVGVDGAAVGDRTLAGLRLRTDAAVEHDDGEWAVVDPGAAGWLAAAGPDRPPADAALDVLGRGERRAVLAHLSLTGTATVDELADYAAARAAVEPDDPEDLRVSLHQVHVPRLADAGAVERLDDGRVRLTPTGEGLLPLLDVVTAYGDR